ncbi:MAG TPA: tetratricopeptide repeat protein [Vicinamibacterales bacterium]|nr:tetratricopeptide repeat protein [Vicinamibacterales bacterium]
MSIDRETALRQAEKLQREGKLDLAIAAYARLVEAQPRDWNTINTLGDLYLRAGDVDRGVAQFVQIADHLFSEGFFPKAAALYKKTLKAKPDHEHTLLRLAEIAGGQELLADARAYLRKLWELRSERGDERGAAECLVRLASLPQADAETILTAARVSRALGDNEQAASLFRGAAGELQKAGRDAAALEALAQVMSLQPTDTALRRELVGRYVTAGQLDQVGALLDAETAGSEPDLLLALGQIELSRKDDAAACATLTRFITVATERSPEVLRLAGELGRAGDAQRAFMLSEIVVDDAVLRGDWDRAIDVLQQFLVHGPHLPALVKLVQVAGDAGHEDVLQESRERLADAYLENGQGPDAQSVAEVLFEGAPESAVHAARLRRAMEMTGVEDPDAAVQAIRARLFPASVVVAAPAAEPDIAVTVEEIEIEAETAGFTIHGVDDDLLDLGPAPELESPPEVLRVNERANQPAEIDLSDALAALGGSSVASTAGRPQAGASLEAIFEAMRPRGADYRTVAEGAELYERGLRRLEDGEIRDGLADLAEAARVPAFRFPAASRLGREYVARGHAHAGIEWLERAAEMPAPTRDAGLAVLYDLGVALNGVGESTRALAVMMELEADEPNYRDVRQRLQVLARAEEERRG